MVGSIDRADAEEAAGKLGVSTEAFELTRASDVLDLHVDSFIWRRTVGYDVTRRHRGPILGSSFAGHADLPRLTDAGFTGATWVITTNPLRGARGRAKTLEQNVAALTADLDAAPGVRVVRTAAEYEVARAAGLHGAFLGVQGGNALGPDATVIERLPPLSLLRVTLVHLTNSNLGTTSSPLRLGADGGLTDLGREVIAALESARIFVDLAHASRKTFFDAASAHDKTKPLLVTHTGVSGVYPHWRNLDDEQLRAIADTGGVVGIMYHVDFLGPKRSRVTVETVVDHIAHVIATVGEDFVALGSDWDGAITTPRDMPTCAEFPRLVDAMLRRGFSTERVRKIVGGNFLRCVRSLRG